MADRKREDEDDLDDELDAGADDAGDDAVDAELPEDDALDDDDDEIEEEGGGGRGRLFLIAGITAAFVIGVAAGGYFFFVAGDDEIESVATAEGPTSEDGTAMVIPRRRMMTAEELAKKGATPPSAAEPKGIVRPPGSTDNALTPPPPAAAPTAQAPQAPAPQAAAPQATAPAPPPVAAPQAAAKGPTSAKGAKGKAGPAPQAQQPGTGLVTPSATAVAYRDIPLQPQGKPLTGPIASLIETTEAGQLPRTQGSQVAWKVYARPFDGPADKPKIAVIVTGLGLARAPTLAAVNQLPGAVTLAFDPYARNLDEWLGLGRSNGHEALLHLPMESNDFPVSDPGPLALLTDFDATQNIARMHQVLASAIGYVGVLQIMGSKFAASEAAMRPVLEETKKRGLLFVGMTTGREDRGATIAQEIQLPSIYPDLKLDAVPSATAIDAQLTELEKIAREQGSAVALAEPFPVTIAKIAAWSQSLTFKELALAPVSSVVTVPPPPPPPPAAKK